MPPMNTLPNFLHIAGAVLLGVAVVNSPAQEAPRNTSDKVDLLAFPDKPVEDGERFPITDDLPKVSQEMPPRPQSQALSPAAPQPPSPLVQRGYMAMNVNDMGKAVMLFEQALAENADDKDAKFGLGTAYIKLKRPKEAIEILDALYRKFPQDYHIINNLAWLYATAKDVTLRDGTQAIRLAQEALMIRPDDHHVWSTLAEAYYVSGTYERALRASTSAYEMAMRQNLQGEQMQEYAVQVRKCRQAVAAMSLLD